MSLIKKSIFVCLLISLNLFSQVPDTMWTRTFGGPGTDQAYCIEETLDGGFIFTGKTRDSVYTYISLTKIDSAGNTVWSKTFEGFEGSPDMAGRYVQQTNDSGFIIIGNKFILENSNYIQYATLIKTDANGNTLWDKSFNDGSNIGIGYSGQQASDGGYIITGALFDTAASVYNVWLIKTDANGNLLWDKTFGGSESNDQGKSVRQTSDGGYIVTGITSTVTGGYTCWLIKTDTNGNTIWDKTYGGISSYNTGESVLQTPDGGYIIVGSILSFGSGDTEAWLIKTDVNGDSLWSKTFGGIGTAEIGYSIKQTSDGGYIFTGKSNNDLWIVRTDGNGNQLWNKTFGELGFDVGFSCQQTSDDGYIAGGYTTSFGAGLADAWIIKLAPELSINNPGLYDKWISGYTDTIKWTETGWIAQNIKCILNAGTPIEQTYTIEDGIFLDSAYYVWDVPDTLLSYQSKIVIENSVNPTEKLESQIFRIKPYVLTRVESDSTYYAYKKSRDQWGFSNIQADMWPPAWYNQFDYRGDDPFTGSQYSQWQGDSTFNLANSSKHPDWISFVNTFTVDACYFSTLLNIYKSAAVIKWKSIGGNWGGSCFGIAGANALAFSFKDQFVSSFPEFPNFTDPVSVVSNDGVKKVVNQIFTHQFGNPSISNDGISVGIKTPATTVNELKELLLPDNCIARSITIWNNSGRGGHTILPYGLKQDDSLSNIYRIIVYDNSNPNSNNPITVDTSQNSGNGNWNTSDWPGWGGNFNLYLEITANTYLSPATLTKTNKVNSPFFLRGDVVEIYKPSQSSIKIIDDQGNITGFYNNTVYSEIPGSVPRVIKNGSETPPYGFSVITNNYSVILNEFSEDTVNTFFFTGNKSFSYERYGATQTQTDRLFFDGGVSVSNPDAQSKTIKLLNLINEATQEKLCIIRSLELVQNESVKIENPDSNKVKLISYGSAKDYDIELNYTTENGVGRFGDFNIPLSANTSHTFVPNWEDITNSNLKVLVDVGNDGIIDDTLNLINVVGVEDQGQLLSPKNYNLSQNYPNPFNPSTTIQYSIPQKSNVSLKVYDIIGNEVATLVDEEKNVGVYTVNFNASQFASGIYFYKLQSGNFVETKKMILLK